MFFYVFILIINNMTNYILENGVFGTKFIPASPWDDSMTQFVREKQIPEVCINHRNWSGENLDFLFEIKYLKAFTLVDFSISDIHALNALTQLEYLYLETYAPSMIDLKNFSKLTYCALRHVPNVDGIEGLTNIQSLLLHGGKSVDTATVGKLSTLQSLSLIQCKLYSLEGLGNLKNLRKLIISNNPELRDLRNIGKLQNLESLEIEACKKIASIDELRTLVNLKKLYINDCGQVESLTPLLGLNELENFKFSESTNIVDGDLSFILNHPILDPKKVGFKSRSHYTKAKELKKTKYTASDIRKMFP